MNMKESIMPGVLYDRLDGAQCWMPWMIRIGFNHRSDATNGNKVLSSRSNVLGLSFSRSFSRTPGRYFGPSPCPVKNIKEIAKPIRKHHLNSGYSELNIRSEPSRPHMSELAYNGNPSFAQVNRLGCVGVQSPLTPLRMKFCVPTATKQVIMMVPI